MSKTKIAIGGLVFAFAAAVLIRCDELKYNPEIATGGHFDNAVITFNNFFVNADLPNEDAITLASYNAFQTSLKNTRVDKVVSFAKDVFEFDLIDPKRLSAQKQRDFYGLISDRPLGNQNHVYSESAIRGFYYFLINHFTGDASLVKKMAERKLSTKDLAESASAFGMHLISPDLEKIKSLGNAVHCFQVATLLKAKPDWAALVADNQKVSPSEMSKYFYDKVHSVMGEETDVLIVQGDMKSIADHPNLGNMIITCAAQPQIALGRFK